MRSNADAVGAAAATRASCIQRHCMGKVGQRPQPCEIDRFRRRASVGSNDAARVRAQNHACAVFSRSQARCMNASVLLSLASLSGPFCSPKRLRTPRSPSGTCESTTHALRRRVNSVDARTHACLAKHSSSSDPALASHRDGRGPGEILDGGAALSLSAWRHRNCA